MPKVVVSQSQWMDRPVAEVYQRVRQFQTWPRWSPWLVAAPGFDLEFREESYSWAGEVCGQGEMRILAEIKNEGIEYELTTVRPRRARAAVAMRFVEKDGGTEVTWSFAGRLPWFVFWMKWSLQASVGADYERGLKMLKDLVEMGEVRSRVECPGLGGCAPFIGVGIRKSVPYASLDEEREADLRAVRESYPDGEPMTVYEKRELRKGRVTYVTGVKLERMPGVVADGMALFEFPGSEVFTVRHFGALRHSGNGWAGGQMHLQAKRLKRDRKLAPFEVCEDRHGEEPVVRIIFPLR